MLPAIVATDSVLIKLGSHMKTLIITGNFQLGHWSAICKLETIALSDRRH